MPDLRPQMLDHDNLDHHDYLALSHDFDDDNSADEIDLTYLMGDDAAQAAADAAAQDAQNALAVIITAKRLHSMYRGEPQVPFTVLARSDGPLTKRITLVDGQINSDGSRCGMPEGAAHRTNLGFPHEFSAFIGSMGEREAIVLGSLSPGLDDRCNVVTKSRLTSLNGAAPRDLIARSQDYFRYQPGQPAMMLIDVDTKTISPTARQRMADLGGAAKALVFALPVLAEAAAVVRHSTSSGISNTETGEYFPDSGGLHWFVRIMIEQADTPKTILTRMHQRAWLAGFGWGWVDQVGKVHSRSLVDPVVANAERLVFEAGPELGGGLVQDRQRREPIPMEGRTLTLDDFPDLTSDETVTVQRLFEAERTRLKPDSVKAEVAYVDVRKRDIQASKPEMTAAEALRAAIKELKSIQAGKLEADCPLVFDSMTAVTVADVLADPERYVGRACADPVEGPNYGRQTAMLLRNKDGNLWVRSHAHGGQGFNLPEEPTPLPAASMPMPLLTGPVLEMIPEPATQAGFAHRNAADMDWDSIPCTPWLHGQRLVRGQVSVLTGSGGIGKTAVTMVVAVSLVIGRNLVDPTNTDPRWKLHEPAPLKVFLYNLEDDYAETNRRTKAVLNHHGLTPADLGRNLEMGDGTVIRLIVAIADKKTGEVTRQACVDELIEWLIATGIDVLILDPLKKAHRCEENSNDDMDEVLVILKEIAIRANCAVWIAHHSGKAGTSLDATGSRGATAITGAARVCETMTKPTADEKQKFGLEGGAYVRLETTKANMSAADANSMWLQLEGVAIGNASPIFPLGDYRQVMTLIHPQGTTDRMHPHEFEDIFAELRKLDETGVWGKAKQGKVSAWVGRAFIAAGRTEAQSKLMINEWTANHLLEEAQVQNPKTRKNYWGLRLNEIEARRHKENAR